MHSIIKFLSVLKKDSRRNESYISKTIFKKNKDDIKELASVSADILYSNLIHSFTFNDFIVSFKKIHNNDKSKGILFFEEFLISLNEKEQNIINSFYKSFFKFINNVSPEIRKNEETLFDLYTQQLFNSIEDHENNLNLSKDTYSFIEQQLIFATNISNNYRFVAHIFRKHYQETENQEEAIIDFFNNKISKEYKFIFANFESIFFYKTFLDEKILLKDNFIKDNPENSRKMSQIGVFDFSSVSRIMNSFKLDDTDYGYINYSSIYTKKIMTHLFNLFFSTDKIFSESHNETHVSKYNDFKLKYNQEIDKNFDYIKIENILEIIFGSLACPEYYVALDNSHYYSILRAGELLNEKFKNNEITNIDKKIEQNNSYYLAFNSNKKIIIKNYNTLKDLILKINFTLNNGIYYFGDKITLSKHELKLDDLFLKDFIKSTNINIDTIVSYLNENKKEDIKRYYNESNENDYFFLLNKEDYNNIELMYSR